MACFSRRAMMGAAASAAALYSVPLSIKRALAMSHGSAGSSSIADVRHVVILTQENRSFDHYFGTMPGVRGFGDRFPIPIQGNRDVWQQTYTSPTEGIHAGSDANEAAAGPSRILYPYALDPRKGNAQRAPNTLHGWPDGQAAWDNGRKGHWPSVKRPCSMGYYTRESLPYHFALAEAFTVCDAYHCSINSSTHPNRLMMMTGNIDEKGEAGGPAFQNEFETMGPSSQGYAWTTYPERLERAGVSWKLYQNAPDFYEDNALVGFRQYRRANERHGNAADGSPYPAYEDAHNAGNVLYKGIANTMPDGGMLHAFREDIARGALPRVAYIAAPAAYCEHADPSSPIQGGWYTEQVLEALTENPEIWRHTVLIINFDENDGFFDHAVQPAAPSYNPDGTLAGKSTVSTEGEYLDRFVTGLGPRVPATIVSPWSQGGWVNSEIFDHTSIIRFLERCFGVEEPSINAYRRAICGDLTSCFDFTKVAHASASGLKSADKDTVDTLRHAQETMPPILPPSSAEQMQPRQEIGTRPSRPLPYQLRATSSLNPTENTLSLTFDNSGTAAAVFHVYDKLRLEQVPRRYTVEAGKSLQDIWPLHSSSDDHVYDLWVLGPNGFHRAFIGSRMEAAPDISVHYIPAENAITVELHNPEKSAVTFRIKANAYMHTDTWLQNVGAGETMTRRWPLGACGGWYDFSARLIEARHYLRRFAGRMETGQPSITDPAHQSD